MLQGPMKKIPNKSSKSLSSKKSSMSNLYHAPLLCASPVVPPELQIHSGRGGRPPRCIRAGMRGGTVRGAGARETHHQHPHTARTPFPSPRPPRLILVAIQSWFLCVGGRATNHKKAKTATHTQKPPTHHPKLRWYHILSKEGRGVPGPWSGAARLGRWVSGLRVAGGGARRGSSFLVASLRYPA